MLYSCWGLINTTSECKVVVCWRCQRHQMVPCILASQVHTKSGRELQDRRVREGKESVCWSLDPSLTIIVCYDYRHISILCPLCVATYVAVTVIVPCISIWAHYFEGIMSLSVHMHSSMSHRKYYWPCERAASHKLHGSVLISVPPHGSNIRRRVHDILLHHLCTDTLGGSLSSIAAGFTY